MNFSIHQASHIGNRKYNQDRVAYAYNKDTLLLVLADGMGGHLHGEMAAGLVMDTFVTEFAVQSHIAAPMQFLADTMRCAHGRIMALPHNDDGNFPGTTCVAALIQNGRIYWGHAGDSRLYLIRDGKISARTLDHSMVQMWLELGVIDEVEARTHPKRNQITNCLGGVEDLFNMESGEPVELRSGDVVVLSSDGLCGPALDNDFIAAFTAGDVTVALDKLIETAFLRERGRADNVTGLAMRWGNGTEAHETDETVSNVLEIH